MAPRGNPQAAVQAKKASVHDNSGDDGCESNALRHLVRNGHETLVTGQECINACIERNTEYEIQKAFVIQVFITTILTWKLGILDAIQKAADVTGFSVWSVRKWVSGFLQSVDGVPLDDIDDETVTLLLSSERGKTCKNPGSLINDEEFCLKAREFVWCHAYKRGEPNLMLINSSFILRFLPIFLGRSPGTRLAQTTPLVPRPQAKGDGLVRFS